MPSIPHSVAVQRKSLLGSLFFMAAAVAGNYAYVPLFWGVHALFGSVAVLAALRFYGAKWGFSVAAASGIATALLLNNPYLMLVQ